MPPASMDFFRDPCSVRWYRGMSRMQAEACEALFYALRDDTEQGSTFRVHSCLSKLGLNPLVKSALLKAIMGISQGSVLAFLWFLWEAVYKQPCGKHEDTDAITYTVNEQLLLSGIAHLDMPATMRALETLLPPVCQSTKPQPQCRNGPKKTLVRSSQPRPRDQDVLPYFVRQVRPRPYIPRGKCRMPESKLKFPEYSQYADPLHEILNDQTRWFAEYQLCPEKRVIKKLLNEELKRLVSGKETEETQPLCETHRFLEDDARRRQQEKAHEVFQRCLSLMDVEGSQLKARRKWIVADLEREIECAADKIREKSRQLLSQVKCMRGEEGTASCQLCNLLVSTPKSFVRRRADLSILMGLSNGDKPRVHLFDQQKKDDTEVKVMLLQRNEHNRCAAGDCQFVKVKEEVVKKKDKQIQLPLVPNQRTKVGKTASKASLRSRKSKKSEESIAEQPSKTTFHVPNPRPACSRTLRCLRRKATPGAESQTFIGQTGLNYHKIFDLPGIPEEHMPLEDPDYVNVEDKQPMIEKLCIAALNQGQSKKIKEFRQDEFLPPVLRAAATCAVDLFRTQMAPKPKTIEPEEKHEERGNDEPIDPDNWQQIEDILKAALQILRSNPHFVLASFPNAHKLPVLVDWVADRYGKTFSEDEMHALAKSSINNYKRIYMDGQGDQREVLRLKRGITELSGQISYTNLKSFKGLAQQRKAKYHNKLNELALEQTRLTWMALRGYSHLGGQIKDTFFAYMPAREVDLKREHMWRSHDFRNMIDNRRKGEKRRST